MSHSWTPQTTVAPPLDIKGEEIQVGDRILHAALQYRSAHLVDKVVTKITDTSIHTTTVDADYSGYRSKGHFGNNGTKGKVYVLERNYVLPPLECKFCGLYDHDVKREESCPVLNPR